MLKYTETNWRNQKGFATSRYDFTINTISPSRTRKEQQKRVEKISLVAFLNKEQKKFFVNLCRCLKSNNKYFYQNKNLHVTLFGFGILKQEDCDRIQQKIQEFIIKKLQPSKLTVRFDTVRPGAYSDDKRRPVNGISNGTIIAYGDISSNNEFCNYSNNLGIFLLEDKQLRSALGSNFRRKFPNVWCTLGYYDNKQNFKIGNDLENFLKKYNDLRPLNLEFSISEILLVKSKYKNLRYPKLLEKIRF